MRSLTLSYCNQQLSGSLLCNVLVTFGWEKGTALMIKTVFLFLLSIMSSTEEGTRTLNA